MVIHISIALGRDSKAVFTVHFFHFFNDASDPSFDVSELFHA
ncbi:hypothetical protein GCM10011499_10100 [Pelagibacterium lentulum]|uniref:Uncharacterized protein n=1 Tax=Pelagibacterium lentulum TaxID=2029865 RepID=A0A916R756_9HYPH|nr:hypothetical protein GCM10011499_10100 [Pelagibacterium lentulum]